MVLNACGTILVHKQVMNLQGSTWLKLGKITMLLPIVYFVILHRGYIKLTFFVRIPKWNPKIVKVITLATLKVHNFLVSISK
jgi:hypothetical protein